MNNTKSDTQADVPVPSTESTNESTISSISSYSRRPGRGSGRGFGRGGRGRGRGGRGYRRRNFRNDNSSKSFKGETAELNDNVFQTPAENPPVTQFKDSVQALERYAFKTYTGVDWQVLFSDFDLPDIAVPDDLKPKPSKVEKKIHNLRLAKYIKDEAELKSSLAALFWVIWGQCSKPMIIKLQSEIDNIKKCKREGRCDILLKEI